MDQRERFEAHMRSRGETYLYRRDVPGSERFGQYCLQSMQREWENWQAAEVGALERAAQLCDEHAEMLEGGATGIGATACKVTAMKIRDLVNQGTQVATPKPLCDKGCMDIGGVQQATSPAAPVERKLARLHPIASEQTEDLGRPLPDKP